MDLSASRRLDAHPIAVTHPVVVHPAKLNVSVFSEAMQVFERVLGVVDLEEGNKSSPYNSRRTRTALWVSYARGLVSLPLVRIELLGYMI